MIDTTAIRAKLLQMPAEIETATLAYGQTMAAQCEAAAKRDRPWTDRTGQARQRLRGYVEQYDTGVRICLEHGVDYGAELELGHEKRYAIIRPTLDAEAPKIIKGWNGLVKKL